MAPAFAISIALAFALTLFFAFVPAFVPAFVLIFIFVFIFAFIFVFARAFPFIRFAGIRGECSQEGVQFAHGVEVLIAMPGIMPGVRLFGDS